MRVNYKENPLMQLRGSKQAVVAGGAVFAALALAACSSSSSSSSSSAPAATGTAATGTSTSTSGTSSASGTINASGSTFQTNFQQAAIQAFKATNPQITVNYGGGGSGKGRTDLAGGTVQFAGSDSKIPASEQANFNGKTVLYFPVQFGPIAMAYNVSGVSNLKLDSTVLAGIFQGTIKTWNDPAIKALNSGVTLPSTPITLVVRSDSSGTTANFSKYMVDAAGSAWKLGTAGTITWPSSAKAANGGSGVAQAIKATDGSIGYVDDSTAKAAGLSAASVKNKSGAFVAPSSAGAAAAAAQVTPSADLTFSSVDEPGATTYPITYQSWDLVYAKQPNANTANLLKAYIGYLLGPGQQLLTPLGLAPLPSSIDAKAVAQLSQITS
jgi:phosphate transport system substrate-binding protein